MANYTNTNTTVVLSDLIREVYSKEILLTAEPVMKWFQFAQKKTELGVTPGHTIEMLRLGNLNPGVRLGEPGVDATEAGAVNTAFSNKYGYSPNVLAQSSIPMNKMSTSRIGIRVHEYGNGIEVSELELRSSFEDTLSHASILLGRDYAKTVDNAIRDEVFSRVTNRVYGGLKSARTALASDSSMSMEVLRETHEHMATNKVVPFAADGSEAYFAFIHPHHARKLRGESNFLEVTKYTTPEIAVSGEIGKMEKIRMIETTALPIIKGAGVGADFSANTKIGTTFYLDDSDGMFKTYTATQYGAEATAYTPIMLDGEIYGFEIYATYTGGAFVVTGSQFDVYQAAVFGDYAFACATALPVELRDGGVQEHGRLHQLVWYAIFGAGVLNTDSIFILETV